jgi:hypothetical protein
VATFRDPVPGDRPRVMATADTGRLTLVTAPDSAHPRLVRVLVDDEPVGDLCFPSGPHQASFVAALVGHGLATLDHERELIAPYDPELFDAPARGPHHPPGPQRVQLTPSGSDRYG